ncbi:uncharacterized protein YALI1_F24525g [Yarrowia lipolytica]|uniref:Uncharacterized protein n=1 Tax=Yarrowia lipolytica TaxID=4952 RepID=A0A1D8NP16_YARLL|nr:hypothetical protein YALI1_F24525g [Yarrowia lipolytica]
MLVSGAYRFYFFLKPWHSSNSVWCPFFASKKSPGVCKGLAAAPVYRVRQLSTAHIVRLLTFCHPGSPVQQNIVESFRVCGPGYFLALGLDDNGSKQLWQSTLAH